MEYLIMCIGNRDGGDDSVGPYVADKLKNTDIKVIDCGTTPENYTSVVKNMNPTDLFIVDAVDMELEPGDIRIVPKEKIGVMTISTHGIPVSVLMDYLERYVRNIFLIGIQPKTISGEISDVVRKSADELIKIIENNEIKKIEVLS